MRSIGEGIIVIPDVHGRSFWHEAADRAGDKHIVFLGDYVDPFPDEGISAGQAIEELKEIISIKRYRPDKTTLLLGNHDLQYLWPDFPQKRYDIECAAQYSKLFKDNKNCFDLTASFQANDIIVVLTHAGILPKWVEKNRTLFGLDYDPLPNNVLLSADIDKPNRLWRENNDTALCRSLSEISVIRGGNDTIGSMVWADTREMLASPEVSGVFQVFGHTRQYSKPLITKGFACIDCMKAFYMDMCGTLSTISK